MEGRVLIKAKESIISRKKIRRQGRLPFKSLEMGLRADSKVKSRRAQNFAIKKRDDKTSRLNLNNRTPKMVQR